MTEYNKVKEVKFEPETRSGFVTLDPSRPESFPYSRFNSTICGIQGDCGFSIKARRRESECATL
jgi:hypothetical protein